MGIAFAFACGGSLHAETEGEGSRESTPTKTDSSSLRLLELHHRALGGVEALSTIQTIHATGTMKEGGQSFRLDLRWKRPGFFRMEMGMRHLGTDYLEVHGYNGFQFWLQNVKPTLEPPSGLDASDQIWIRQFASFVSPLYAQSGHRKVFQYMGEVNSHGSPTFLLKAVESDKSITYYYLDKSNLLIRRIGYTARMAGQQVDADIFITRYERKNGVLIPSRIEFSTGGRAFRTIEYSSFTINQEMDNNLFVIPSFQEHWLRN